ncbi:MAG: hypothetical protein U1E02_14105 [Hydrogenophaga sp.]|nr:hypothetical protein [Hydrogenophaga sp.]
MTRSTALEAVARGAGMTSWHRLHSLAQALIDDFNPDVHWPRPDGDDERVMALKSAFPMLARADKDCSPSPEVTNGMSTFAAQLAPAANISVERARDIVAQLNGADTWEQLLRRQPMDSQEPLYRFIVEEGEFARGGRFEPSKACAALIDELDHLRDGLVEEDLPDAGRLGEWLKSVTAKRPDFLDGLQVQAEVCLLGYEQRRTRAKACAHALSQAVGLIPSGFKGQILWAFNENRFLHRLLFGYMRDSIFYGSRTRGISLARKQLRWNPNDEMGVRYFLPVLLASTGQIDSAMRALRKTMEKGSQGDANAQFTWSLVSFAKDNPGTGIACMLKALFLFPALRDVVASNSREPFGPIPASQRRVTVLDRWTLLDQYVALTPVLEALEEWMPALLNDSLVREAELAPDGQVKFPHPWPPQIPPGRTVGL